MLTFRSFLESESLEDLVKLLFFRKEFGFDDAVADKCVDWFNFTSKNNRVTWNDPRCKAPSVLLDWFLDDWDRHGSGETLNSFVHRKLESRMKKQGITP